ncbi:MAG TPA: hypothetical protein DCS07_03330 [Bdellovibrionales bacterium]|nr:MAG: hypothetical protein A2Z97_06830 [Bdellovibrionales bacterium GWB1_52_6]OFZ05476.1 MAG: hypothetical protein A2X97_11410 [Bdellovibrionales bacterium GWA1_52_35]OFZ38410.1 MAG: hypothetical protein A2070_00830 [Bdellovibrionales bacterium GWC1_52_8]HAR41654.1 hypothetical protein [Bdellovibrionales bacterium]HCM39158.1 hypothetical protein [Bdellovibrionales bacterium]
MNQWIKAKDFLKTTFEISVKNVTTHTSVAASTVIDLIEVNENGLVLKLPKSAGALGHLLMIRIVRKKEQQTKNSTDFTFDFTGKVIAMDALEATASAVSLQFYQFNENDWKNFLKESAERQNSVNALIKKVQE